MVLFPNCKINLGLNIICKRTDGYHNIETVFYPIPFTDALEAIEATSFHFTVTGLSITGSANDNLCLKAYHLLKKDFPDLPVAHIHLHKAIPMGAGMGGGSSDGAFMLLLLNKKFNLQLSEAQLVDYALLLGSDCPFFIYNKPLFATGRGERMVPVNIDLSGYKFVIVNPGIHISTREAFAALTPTIPAKRIDTIISQPVTTWKEELVNDFEQPLFIKYPAITAVKAALYSAGATYAAMTGSGSTVFGIFDQSVDVQLSFPDNYLQYQLPTL